jgi:hypothetical protein
LDTFAVNLVLVELIVSEQRVREIGRIGGMLLGGKIALRRIHAKNGSPAFGFPQPLADSS